MRDRKKWKARTGTAGKILLTGALVIVCVRYSVLTYKDLTRTDAPAVHASAQEQVALIPEAARSTGKMFLWNWYYTAQNETANSKLKRIESYISSDVANTLQNEQEALPMEQMTPLRVESWDEKEQWIQSGKRAVLTYRVMLEDGRNLLVSVPVVNAGTWMVDGLPSLLPEPAKENPPSPEQPDIDQGTLAEISSALDTFFPMWLSGKEEANNRYVIGKLPLDNVLGKIQGVYEEVAVKPISEKPTTVRALVKIRTAQETLSFEYTVVLEEVDGQWKIKELY